MGGGDRRALLARGDRSRGALPPGAGPARGLRPPQHPPRVRAPALPRGGRRRREDALGARAYLPEERYREAFASGRIAPAELDAALADRSPAFALAVPGFPPALEIARLVLLHGVQGTTRGEPALAPVREGRGRSVLRRHRPARPGARGDRDARVAARGGPGRRRGGVDRAPRLRRRGGRSDALRSGGRWASRPCAPRSTPRSRSTASRWPSARCGPRAASSPAGPGSPRTGARLASCRSGLRRSATRIPTIASTPS